MPCLFTMFDCLSLLARQIPRSPSGTDVEFRKLDTLRGSFFVQWEPRAINALLSSERLSAEDLEIPDPRHLHRLIRELLLLGLRDEMESCRRSPITQLARSLMRRKRPPHREADPGVLSAA